VGGGFGLGGTGSIPGRGFGLLLTITLFETCYIHFITIQCLPPAQSQKEEREGGHPFTSYGILEARNYDEGGGGERGREERGGGWDHDPIKTYICFSAL